MPAPVFDAVTVILQHGQRVFMTRRQPYLKAFPGYHTFPGGKVDKTDSDAPYADSLLSTFPPRLIRAMVRELREELDYDLEQAIADGEVLGLRFLGNAITPPTQAFRFNTHFFVLRLKQEPSIRLDTNEASEAGWATPAEWITRYDAGELLAALPTQFCLRGLAEDENVPTISKLLRPFNPEKIPLIESIAGVGQMMVLSNTLPPADNTNCFIIGDDGAPRIMVDPSPGSREVFERLCATVEAVGIDEVFLTHHHPDHREFADDLARHLNVPIAMSADTHQRILEKSGPEFFAGLQLKIYRDGDVATRWLGHPVRVLAVPGHDEGQLALMPDNAAWCIVGDLIQGVGTVVISKPEGNMRRYFESLQRLIELKPRVIFPSHGIGMGTTFRLEETLRHRQQRETQVLAMQGEGKTIEQMLTAIYADVDPRLLPLARRNIESHLDKLREDGALA